MRPEVGRAKREPPVEEQEAPVLSELGWFREQVRRSIVAPRAFARTLPREHYGLAGVAVALAAGASLSFAVDTLVVAARGVDPILFAPRLISDAVFTALRISITLAVLAFAVRLALGLARHALPNTDQLFTAMSFATAPLLVAFPIAIPVLVVPEASVLALVALVALAVRVVYGLALNVAALLPRRTAAVTFVALVAAASFALADQGSRVRYVAVERFPDLAPTLAAAPPEGTREERFGIALTVPPRWQNASRGIAGQLLRFETENDYLVVTRARGGAFLTPGDLADEIARDELFGMVDRTGGRDIVRIQGMIVVDDRAVGVYEGRRIAYRQFTTVRGREAYALVFRMIEPADPDAALAEAARIASTWELPLSAP